MRTSYSQIVGLFVMGTTDVDKIEEVNRIRVPTLWPCSDVCVPELEHNPRVSDSTLIVSAGFGRRTADRVYQAHLFGQIKQMYSDGSWEADGQKTQYDIVAGGPARLSVYDLLVAAEATRAADHQRSPAELAQMALLSALPGVA